MPRVLLEQGTELWLETRKGKITASLAAAVLGLDPHTGPLSAFNQIMGRRKAESLPMRYGTEMQAEAESYYEGLQGVLVAPGGFWVHDDHPWLGASPDGLVAPDGLVEIKCPARLPHNIPEHYRVQMRVQLAVTGRAWCDFFAYCPHDPQEYYLERLFNEQADAEPLLASLAGWYDAYVATNTPPPRRRKQATPAGKEGKDET